MIIKTTKTLVYCGKTDGHHMGIHLFLLLLQSYIFLFSLIQVLINCDNTVIQIIQIMKAYQSEKQRIQQKLHETPCDPVFCDPLLFSQ